MPPLTVAERNSVLSWLVRCHTDEHFNLSIYAIADFIQSREFTKQNAHKRVPALDLQSLIKIFGFSEKRNVIYEGGLEPRTFDVLKRSTSRPLRHSNMYYFYSNILQGSNCNKCLFLFFLRGNLWLRSHHIIVLTFSIMIVLASYYFKFAK